MIIPKFFLLLVCLFQAQRTDAFNYKIDVKRCGTNPPDAACFVRDSCIEKDDGEGMSDVLALFTDQFLEEYDDKLEPVTCDIIVQIKPLNSSKWHVMMKVTGTDLTADKGISFTQGATQFSCKPGMTSLEGELEPKEFGGGHKFSSDSMACSIIFDTSLGKIADRFSGNTNKPTLLYYVNGQQQKVEFASKGNTFWALPKVYCNHDKIKSKDGIDGNFVLHEVDTTVRRLGDSEYCKAEHGRIKIRLNGTLLDAFSLQCETMYEPEIGLFKYVDPERPREHEVIIIDPAIPSFEVYCAVELCSKCPDFVLNKKCKDCVVAVISTEGNCKIASCPHGKKWRMEDGSLLDATVECKQILNGRHADWFFTGEASEEIVEGTCSDKFDCHRFSKLNYSCSANDGCDRRAPQSSDRQTISCRNGFDLKFGSTTVDKLTCDPSTGLYSSGQIKAEQGANVYCKKKPAAAAVPMSAETIAMLIAIGVAILFIIIILFAVVNYLRHRPKKSPASLDTSEEGASADISISPKFFILLVCLLQAPRVFGFKYEIDLKRCKADAKDATCFVRESCITRPQGEPQGKSNVLVQLIDQSIDDCDVIVQIKPFTQNMWHVMMKVTGTALTTHKGIIFSQGTTQFGCKPGMIDLEGELEPDEFGSGHEFSPNSMTCSIIFDSSPKTYVETFSRNSNKPVLSYFVNGQEQKVEFASKGSGFWSLPKVFCYPGDIISRNGIIDGHIMHEVDTTLPIILNHRHCIQKYGRLSSLKIHHNNEYIDIDYLYCDTEHDVGKYKYNKGQKEQVIIDPETTKFEVYCAVCPNCPDFVYNTNCPGCSAGVLSITAGNCKAALCPNDHWRQPDGKSVWAHAECKQIDAGKAGWIMKSKEITEGSCSMDYDCNLYSQLDLTCPTKDCTKAILSPDKQSISCPDGFILKRVCNVYRILQYLYRFGSSTVDSLTCNKANGLYTSELSSEVKIKSKVSCQKKSAPPTPIGLAPAEESNLKDSEGTMLCSVIGIVLLQFL